MQTTEYDPDEMAAYAYIAAGSDLATVRAAFRHAYFARRAYLAVGNTERADRMQRLAALLLDLAQQNAGSRRDETPAAA